MLFGVLNTCAETHRLWALLGHRPVAIPVKIGRASSGAAGPRSGAQKGKNTMPYYSGNALCS